MKVHFALLTIFFYSVIPCSFGQPPISWSKCYGGSSLENATDVQQTSDGGYILIGSSWSNDGDVTGNHGLEDYWIVKTDDDGTLQWQKSLGGSSTDIGTSVRQTTDDGYIIGGYTISDDGDVSGYQGGGDAWIVRLDNAGNVLWKRTLGGSLEDGFYYTYERTVMLEQTGDGGYLVGSTTKSNDGDVTNNHGDSDYWLVKLDSTGNIQWQKCYGGSLEERLRDFRKTPDGGFIMAGLAHSTDGDLTGQNISFMGSWIVKTDSAGGIQWQAVYFCIDTLSPNCDGQISVASILPLGNGDYMCAGTVYYYGYVYFYCTTYITGSGLVTVHQQHSSMVNPWRNFCHSIQKSSDNGFILTGQTDDAEDNFYIYKNGTLGQWSFEWDTISVENQIAATTLPTSDGGFIIGGTSEADISCSPNYDSWHFRLMKLGGTTSIPENNFIEQLSVQIRGNKFLISFTFDNSSDRINADNGIQVVLYDVTGRELLSMPVEVNYGFNKKEIETGDLSPGIYVVNLNGAEGTVSKMVVKE